MAHSFTPWLQFESQLAQWMEQLACPALKFSGGRQCIPGLPSDSFRADAALTNDRVLIAVEVEIRQTHPDTNVGKYWLLSDRRIYDKIILFHIYTPAYNSYGWRKTLGEFYAEKMKIELPFEYVLLDKRHATDLGTAFQDVCLVIEPRVRQEFANEFATVTGRHLRSPRRAQ